MKRKYLRKLTVMVSLGLLLSLHSSASAMTDETVYTADGKPIFYVQYFDDNDAGRIAEDVRLELWPSLTYVGNQYRYTPGLTYSYTDNLKNGVQKALNQWAGILKYNAANMKQPVQFVVGTSDFQSNAAAGSLTKSSKEIRDLYTAGTVSTNLDVFATDVTKLQSDMYTAVRIIMGKYADVVTDDAYYGWINPDYSQQYHGDTGKTERMVLFHEIGHTLGITKDIATYAEGIFLNEYGDNDNTFTSHLVDELGNPAYADAMIIVPGDTRTWDHTFTLSKISKTNLSRESAAGRAYFVGDNVSQVLNGKTYYGMNGIPISGWEGSDLNTLDLSHVSLPRSVMSHHYYRSYTTFMEAELAMLQDIGYKIDRRDFYGYSIYNDNLGTADNPFINTNPFYARNADGTAYINGQPNTSLLGVGLHVPGSYNYVLQKGNLFADGVAGAGIRVDGIGNNITVDKDAQVTANGTNGEGILVAYGNRNNITIDGSVSATVSNGTGVRFDFGDKSSNEFRGSYIHYGIIENYDTGSGISRSKNLDLDSQTDVDSIEIGDLNGPMGSLTVNGKLTSNGNAVYISKNAFVDNITVNDGAQITGNIVSDWKHFDEQVYRAQNSNCETLAIQYNGNSYDYDTYVPDLVTALNFNGTINYAGDIIGTDNMKISVKDGAQLNYSGTANVVSITVEDGGRLTGGNYTVNDMSDKMASGASDSTTGHFINKGTIGNNDSNTTLNITGTLDNYGTIKGCANYDNVIVNVNGTANIEDGSKFNLDVRDALPGNSITAFKADTMNLNGQYATNVPNEGTLAMNVVMDAEHGKVDVKTAVKDSISGTDELQANVLNNINSKYGQFTGAGEKAELQAFYNIRSDAKALETLEEMSTKKAQDSSIALLTAQSSTMLRNILSARLATAFGQVPSTISIGIPHLDSTAEPITVDVPVNLPKDFDESTWVKFTKNWGRTAGASNYHGSNISMGYDWQAGPGRRNGLFGSYSTTGYSHYDGTERTYDTRLGYYSGLHDGADTWFWYADLGHIHGKRDRLATYQTLGTRSKVRGDYKSFIAELGGEWKHALQPEYKTWQVSPYGDLQLSYMKHNSYRESGSLDANNFAGGHNLYSAGEVGMECSRSLPRGSMNFRLGVRQAFSGTDYDSSYNKNILDYSYQQHSRMDKTHLVLSAGVDTEFKPGWKLSGEASFQKGAHDRDLVASVQLKRLW